MGSLFIVFLLLSLYSSFLPPEFCCILVQRFWWQYIQMPLSMFPILCHQYFISFPTTYVQYILKFWKNEFASGNLCDPERSNRDTLKTNKMKLWANTNDALRNLYSVDAIPNICQPERYKIFGKYSLIEFHGSGAEHSVVNRYSTYIFDFPWSSTTVLENIMPDFSMPFFEDIQLNSIIRKNH